VDDAVYSVSEVTGTIRSMLESQGPVRVRGEISNYRPSASGHLYFTLKDARSQLRAVMFRGNTWNLRFDPADGIEVEAQGELTVYEPRGDLQLIVRRLAPSGLGALMQAFEALKSRLAAEGLFDPERKRPLPAFPGTVALVTSPRGAAVRDLVHVLSRRWPPVRIVLAPVRVQGEGAALEIAEALDRVGRWGGADVVIVGRGGGSIEDLWAFNEEPVVRAIARCPVPVVSAVGHETDVTIADLVADVRAATPSAAAEITVPDARDVAAGLRAVGERLVRDTLDALVERRRRVAALSRAYGFRRPEDFLKREMQRLDHLRYRLDRAGSGRLGEGRSGIEALRDRLGAQHPRLRLARARSDLDTACERLRRGAERAATARRDRVAALGRTLRSLDPTAVLDRGFCVALRKGRVVRGASGLGAGEDVVLQFRADRARARVLDSETGGWIEEATFPPES